MKSLPLVLALVLGSLGAALLPRGIAAQDVASLEGRVSPEVRRVVRAIAADATARGLPVEPLVQKAIEGAAKGVPDDRVIAAVRALAGRLAEAAGTLRQPGGPAPAADVVEGAADALAAGLDPGQVRELVRISQPPYDPALTLQVAATLTALGVPVGQAVQLLERSIEAGATPGDLLGIPAQVQAGVARGNTPSQAAAGLTRAAGGSPPGRTPGWVPPGQTNPHKPPPNPHKP